MEKAEFKHINHGPVTEHNYLCACCRERSAVLEMWWGGLQPCWDCQKLGYKLIKLNWLDRLFKRGEP